eukprot:m.38443 g.38443  ORF g.38443 m.38443 type:complete len:66 (+) comp9436_c0_seq1:162-359(+)
MFCGGKEAAAPAWTLGQVEPPQGEKDMGGWTRKVYTEEQQARLGAIEVLIILKPLHHWFFVSSRM